ncbi:hypothetical protein EDD16DRAFT_1436338, partial [Pisolithus croceorrhizus]
IAGAGAGETSNLSLFPVDTVKGIMQTEDELRPRGKGVQTTAKEMYTALGISSFYAGCSITVARSIP